MIATSTLRDVGLLTDDFDNVIDKNKLRREKQTVREQLQNDDAISIDAVKDISFDGRKDETLCSVKKGPKFRTVVMPQEHYVILSD